jgi:hypothetical protein
LLTGPALVRNSTDGAVGYASYRVSATLKLTLTRGGQVLARGEAGDTEDYLPDAPGDPRLPSGQNDPLVMETMREEALRRLADTLTREAYERLTTH